MEGRCPLCRTETEELVEAIGKEEVAYICRNCAIKNNFPIIRRPTPEQIRAENQSAKLKVRLSAGAGIEKSKLASKEDRELKRIALKNIRAGDYKDLVDNFHWTIQHARRLKKISQKQLAENIAESELVIAMAEKSKLPENYDRLISKLEQYLGIQLFKERPATLTGISESGFDIKKADLNQVTIGDLKKMQPTSATENIQKEGEQPKEETPKKGFWSWLTGSGEDKKEEEKSEEENETAQDTEKL